MTQTRNNLSSLRAYVVCAVCTILLGLVAAQPALAGTAPRLLAATLLVFFLPGYAVQAALFSRPLPTRTRIALAIGTSPALVGLTILVGNELSARVSFELTVISICLVTVVLLALAMRTAERQTRTTGNGGPGLAETTVTDAVPTPSLSVSPGDVDWPRWGPVLAALVVLVAFFALPAPAQGYTELSLLTTDEQGRLTAEGYPSTMAAGEDSSLTVSVRNDEGRQQRYALVVTRSLASANETLPLGQTQQLTVASGTTVREEVPFSAPTVGGRMRLSFELYRIGQGAGATSTAVQTEQTPIREAWLWITVTADTPTEGA
ncbi:DUF1616 domain-containing protein [Halorientalis sp.]|uniref:DUF1616 domain-containing protein n=1 Tax=Halorientalis sp. TaxID=1931229 RepID=UPI00262A7CD7|nr:DUF1616 domain-containing protein [Halorientalis sp.]